MRGKTRRDAREIGRGVREREREIKMRGGERSVTLRIKEFL